MERYTSGKKVQTAFRLDGGLLARVDAVRGRESRTALVERLLMGWVEQGDGAVSRPVTSATGSAACHAVVPGAASRPPAESTRTKVESVPGDGTPLPKIARRHWA